MMHLALYLKSVLLQNGPCRLTVWIIFIRRTYCLLVIFNSQNSSCIIPTSYSYIMTHSSTWFQLFFLCSLETGAMLSILDLPRLCIILHITLPILRLILCFFSSTQWGGNHIRKQFWPFRFNSSRTWIWAKCFSYTTNIDSYTVLCCYSMAEGRIWFEMRVEIYNSMLVNSVSGVTRVQSIFSVVNYL